MDDISVVVTDLAESIELLIETNNPLCEDFKQSHQDLMKHTKEFSRISEAIAQLHNRCITDDSINREWHILTREINGPDKNRSSHRAKHLVERLRDSWQHLLRDRATRSLTYNDEQFHALEKIKAAETGKRIKSLLADEVRPSIHVQAEALADWYKMAQTLYLQTQILQKDVVTFEESVFEIKERLSHIRNETKLGGNASTNGVKNGQPGNNGNGYGYDLKILSCYLREISALMRQNGELVETIQKLGFEDDDDIPKSMPPDNTRL